MKLFRQKYLWVVTTIVLGIGYAVSCTKDNQVLDVPQVINSSTDLVSVKTSTPPVLDGVIDAMWTNSPKLQFSTVVPEVTGDIFRGFVGNIIPSVTLRSAYDANNIYFLAEWADPTQSLLRQPWYFNPTTQRWAQESANFTFSASGVITRPPFYEDKLAFLWNVDNSVNGWNSGTCYKSCHTGLPASDGSSRHFTNYPTEKIDMWHWKAVRGGVNGGFQFDDQYQDNTYPNGRKSDVGAGAYTDNIQTLPLNGNGTTVSVPKYVVPGRNNYTWLLSSDISSNLALQVVAVNSTGILTLSDGSTIDPNIGTDYQRVGNSVGAKSIPGIIISSYGGSRGDISCKSTYTGNGWILEFQRALKTGDVQKEDVDFSSLADQYFGFAIFENAQIAHSIKANLVLKFKK